MKTFLANYSDRIHGVLSCFDRMLFRGYLPIMSGWQMAQFINGQDLRFRYLKNFLMEQAARVKEHAVNMAKEQNRPYEYLSEKIRKEQRAAEIGRRDGIEPGLVCILSAVEPCRTFFRFMHVRLQTWFPLQIQVYVNGHEWRARKLDRAAVGYVKHDNVFVRIDDLGRAQRFSDRFSSLDWPRLLGNDARLVNPLKKDLLRSMDYYWVTAQSEYSTDILFKSPAPLSELYPRLFSHSTLCFGAKDVMNFLGRKLHPLFQGEVLSDVCDLAFKRIPGARIKYRVKQNWLKMYDKAGSVLRVGGEDREFL